MPNKSYGYQYETSPRKIQPEYDRRNSKNRKPQQTKSKTKTNVKANPKTATKRSTLTHEKIKLFIYIALGFIILLAMSYQNSLITESFNEKEQLKKDLSSIQKENEQLKVNIENSLNLNNIEQAAKELLGMQKLDNTQKRYINLPKKDYVESPIETMNKEDNYSIWNRITNGIKELLKK